MPTKQTYKGVLCMKSVVCEKQFKRFTFRMWAKMMYNSGEINLETYNNMMDRIDKI